MKHCGAEIIPEEELFRLTAEVVGGEVTVDAVRDKITVIRVEKDRTFHLRILQTKCRSSAV